MKSFLNKSFFKQNRENLLSLMLPESFAVLFPAEQFPRNGDQHFKYRQNSDLYYLSGLTQEQSIVVLFKGKNSSENAEFAFIIEPDEKMIIWTGHKYTKQEASEVSGIDSVLFLSEFDNLISSLIEKTGTVYYSFRSNVRGTKYENPLVAEWKNKMSEKRANIFYNDIDPLIMQLRLCKCQQEISTMQNAINITGKTFDNLLNFVKHGVYEYEVEAEMTRNFIAAGANDHAYLPIVASGKNNCILHYNTNRNVCKDGDLLLLDFGAEVDYYAADLTRTIPVSGKFTARQKEVYNSVLSVMKEMKKKMIPGTTINNLNSECEQLIQEELLKLNLLTKEDIANQNPEFPAFKKYYMHGVSHFIGLDVHDTGKKDSPLLPGMILSCEPAIYIAEEGFGIRLENDILVADNPVDLCENIPIEVEDVER